MLNFDRLRLLHKLSVLGSVSAVAEAVHLSRPAVSKQLALLHDEVEVELVQRSGRGIQLTPAGVQLAARAGELMELFESIESDLAAARLEVIGEFRIGSFSSLASSVIPLAIRELQKAHPRLNILVTELEPLEGLRAAASKQMDMAIVDDTVGTEASGNTLEFHPLCADNSEAVVSSKHRLANRSFIQIAELANERWAMSQAVGSFPYRALIAKACTAAGFTPNVTASASLPVALEMVRSAGVIAVLPRLALRHVENDPDFRVIPVEPPIQRHALIAVLRGGMKRPAIAAVSKALINVAETLAATR
ncbi:LysR family transcriptional regulator [Burkholderia contaminans]|uniref:LysR family transcriptional regulator n=1 Tax=Burkholderia contaminans TaxID=488447 RepID=A0A3N8PTL2_9BURK|nr:LysR family transcriptional regulator [Burkholderia contaminans]RQT14952.1 LysR family transcriptional regulator [Burkholderia contaminans]